MPSYLPAFKKIQVEDVQINRIQENCGLKFSQLDSLPFSNGNLIEIPVTTTATAFNHGLNRKPIGWMILDIDAQVTVWRSAAFTDKTITLDASGSANIKVWVF